jgi:hypothetical protein
VRGRGGVPRVWRTDRGSRARLGVQVRRRMAHTTRVARWSARRSGTRDVTRSGMKCCGAGDFDQDLLPKLELKCTEG